MKAYVNIVILLFFCGVIQAQHTTQGRDFWVSFGSNGDNISTTLTFQVRIVTVKASNVTFTFTGLNTSSSIALSAGVVYTRNLSEAERLAVYSNTPGKSQKSLRIQSDEDISVYAINLVERSTDATAVLPVKSLGSSYYHLSYEPLYHDEYILIATENATNVYDNGVWKSVLNEGEVYSQQFDFDATGRHITTDKPVAYFVTNACVNVPVGILACDCLYEQLFPETSWGTSFMAPTTIRGKERIRILAAKNGTTITHNGGTVVNGSLNLNEGQFVEIEIDKSDDKGCYIEANNPVAVISYLTGIEYDNVVYNGDPAMTWIPSIEQSVGELIVAPFIASGSSILSEHHILIVTSTNDKNLTEISIGNNPYSSLSGGYWTDHTSGYSFYSMPLTEANLSYRVRNPGGITVLGYGLGFRESYYYLGGSATRKLNAAFYINDIHYQDLDGKEFCSDNFDIKAVVKYAMHPEPGHIRWFIDGTEEITAQDLLQWTKTLTEDSHTISMIVKDEYGDPDTLTVIFTVDIQKIDVSDTIICKGQSIGLNVKNYSEKLTYRWYKDPLFSNLIQQGHSATSPLMTDTVFYVEALTSVGCSVRDSIVVKLYPVTDLTAGDVDVCNDFTAKLKASSSNAVSIKWYSDPDYSQLIVQAGSFETDKLNADTVFYVEALSANGCITRDTVAVNVYDAAMDDLSVCYGATATVSAPDADIFSLTWYSDPDYSNIVSHANSFKTSKLKNDTVFYLEALSTKGCIAKNAVNITVNPLPVLIVNDTSICAGTTVFAPFSNAESLNWYSDANYSNLIIRRTSHTADLQADTVFYLDALSREGCSIKDSIKISVTLPPVVIAMEDQHLCYGEKITLAILQSEGSVSWDVEPITVKPESTREYTVTASRPPCPDARDNVRITVGDSLHIFPSGLPPYQPYANYFQQLNTNAQSADYTVVKGKLPTGLSLSHSGDFSGTPNGNELIYTFTVQVEDAHNCTASQEYVLEKDFYIPKVFTPNGDGINDFFMQGCEVVIFDRLGMEIFRGTNGWDGTCDNKSALRDIYFYTLTRKLKNGEVKVYNGYVGIQ
ncbi:MAG: gliding motility-associated C-terminal domain-containing protein [Prevotellaceae bacterium]|nr:gliding motility-associated C-terminal domain-containing protein [Prevotellaceae bacterium]